MNKVSLALLVSRLSPDLGFKVGRTGLHMRKQAPHILFGVGVAGSIASTVLACRSTLRLHDTLDEIENDLANIREPHQYDYPVKEKNRDTAYVYTKAVVKLAKLYGPALGVGVISIGCLSGSHIDLSRRNASLMAAYAALQGSFDSYRDRVSGRVGADRELDLYRGVTETKDEEGKKVREITDPNGLSPYARFFDEYSPHWVKDAELNRIYLNVQQNYANEKLRARGHLFLNEVYDMLGLDHSSPGAVVGWLIGKDGDNYVDFGIYATKNAPFVNGQERSVLLDFNVDGVIYDKI